MSYKPYLIPLNKLRRVKQVKDKANNKNIPLIYHYTIKDREEEKYAAVSIDRSHSEVKKIYGKGILSNPISKRDIISGDYKILYERKIRRDAQK